MLVPYLQILHGVAAHHLQLEDRLLAWLLLSMRSTCLDSAPASRGEDDDDDDDEDDYYCCAPAAPPVSHTVSE